MTIGTKRAGMRSNLKMGRCSTDTLRLSLTQEGNIGAGSGTFATSPDRKLAEKSSQFHLAYYDALTELPNRTLLQDRLAKALAAARGHKYKVAVLFLDLDRFKDINDSEGHSVGDLLLQEVATRLKASARDQDTVARLGGDEFLIMLTHIRDSSEVEDAAGRLMDAVTAPFAIQGALPQCQLQHRHQHLPRTRCGRQNAESGMPGRGHIMYTVKEHGRNSFRFFAEDMNTQVVERLTLEKSLRSALQKKELFLMYQPQKDIATGRVTGLEALLRWQHPELGLVPPDKFIRIAEHSGMIVPIGEWVLRTACSQARQWQEEGLPAVTVAVNVSAVQFRRQGCW